MIKKCNHPQITAAKMSFVTILCENLGYDLTSHVVPKVSRVMSIIRKTEKQKPDISRCFSESASPYQSLRTDNI